MKITFVFFGVPRGLLGHRDKSIEVFENTTLKEAIDHLLESVDPSIGKFIKPPQGGYDVSFYINGRPHKDDHVLSPDEEVKLLVPMSGG